LAWLGWASVNAHIKQRTHQTKKSQLGRIKKKQPDPAQQKRDTGLIHQGIVIAIHQKE
jgi:hypothetical protein